MKNLKSYKLLLTVMICALVMGVAGGIFIMHDRHHSYADIVLLNDIAKTAEEDFDDLTQLSKENIAVDYVIFDRNGNAVYSSVSTDVKCVTDAIRLRYPYLMLTDNGRETVGAAILENNDTFTEKRMGTAFIFMGAAGLTVLLCIFIWLNITIRSIIRPFEKMEYFAGRVAEGDLDVPLEMERNNLFGAFTESFDLMRTELAASREREVELKRREKELIASLSHDLKTPITGIKLSAELMQAQTKDPAFLEKLGNIYMKAEQIDGLVNDLFTSTMKDLGEMKVTVADVGSSVLREFVQHCDDWHLAENGEIPDCIITIDSRRMEQIIGNVISNSYKYAGTKITVSYAIIEGYLKMSVRDYGKGVSDDELQLVTNKFYRSKSRSDSKVDGSGLGLYIAKTLMEKMNGELRCVNADPGFEVRLLIPLA